MTDGAGLLQFAARLFFGFGVLAFLLHYLQPAISRLIGRFRKRVQHSPQDSYTSLSLSEIRRRQELARQEIQDSHTNKAQSYKERVLQPREEARQRKREEKVYQFSGPAWKGSGHKLGGEEVGGRNDRGSGDAARSRKLPPEVETSLHVAQHSPPKEKMKLVIPEEPGEGSTGCVCLVLRTPQGTMHKRRFAITNTAQVLLDYMTLLGYHQKLYTLCTSYPRRSLYGCKHHTLQELGFDRDTVINVEPRDDIEEEM